MCKSVLATLVALLLAQYHVAAEGDSHAFDSLIKPVVRGSVYWQVTNEDCTAVHAFNISTGGLNWERSPVDIDQAWSQQVTEKRAFYTLTSGGPAVTAVSLQSGNVRWSWPERVGNPFWKHWDTDLPQASALDTPLPAINAQQLLVRLKGAGSKLIGLDLYNGSRVWELDVAANISLAAQAAGLAAPGQVTLTSWLLDGCNTLYVSVLAQHAASGAPDALLADGAVGQQLNLRLQKGQAAGAEADAHIQGQSSGAGPKADASPAAQQQQQQQQQQQGGQGAWQGRRQSAGDEAPMVQLGWVVSVDVVTGSVQWVAGPLEQGPLGLTLTEPVLLAASTPAPGDTGWLYGLHKVSGAALYSLPCAGGQCAVQVVDTHVGLLTAALLQQQPALDELAAFEFATGKLLWRGVQDSKLLGYVVGDCTGLTDATMHTYFACSCKAAEAAAAGLGLAEDDHSKSLAGDGPALAAQHARGMAGMAADLLDAAPAAPGDDGFPEAASDSHSHGSHHHSGHGHDEHGRKPRPRPDPRPGPGLCAFAISTNSGKLGFEVVLSSTDAVPPGAAAYGLKPFVMADTIVFPGRKAVYAMPRLSAPHPQQQMHNAQPGDASSGSGSNGNVGHVLAAGASEAATSARRLRQQAGGSGVAIKDASSSSSSGSSVRPVFSFSLPTGVVMQPWDWLDLKAGTLLLRASPHFEEGTSNLGLAASGRESSGSSSMGQQPHAGTGMPGKLGTDSSREDGVSGGDGRRRAMETKSKPHWVVDAPHTWLVALDPQNGTRRWSLALDVWLGPLSPHALPHEWGRGGVLLVDGCRPPAADEPDGGTGEGSSGSTCCLHAVSLASGELLWRNCFDMDRTCASGLGRRTATLIVYILLAAQVVVLLLGCVLGVWWHRRMRRRAAASIMQDPDSEDEPLLVQVLPQGYSIPTSGRVVS